MYMYIDCHTYNDIKKKLEALTAIEHTCMLGMNEHPEVHMHVALP